MGTRGVFLGRSITEEETTQLIVQFVLNVCLYLGSAHPDVRHLHAEEIAQITGGRDMRKARATLREQVARLKRERVFLVGSSLPVDSALREHLAQPGAKGSTRRRAARFGTAIE